MAFLMFTILAIFLIAAYFLGDKDLLSPWFLLCLMIFAMFIIILLNYNNWDVEINKWFILYVSTAIISFGFGGAFVKCFYTLPSSKTQSSKKVSVFEAKVVKPYPQYLFLVVSSVLAVLYIYKLLSDVSDVASFSGKLRKIYDNTVNGYTPGFIYNQMREIITAIAYVNTYRLMIRFYARKDKANIFILILPILLFIIAALITTDRNIFLRYAIYFVCLYVLFFYENYKKKNVNFKIIQKVLILGVIALIIFFILGKMKQYSSNFFNSLSIYGGSGLYNYNLWLKDFDGSLLYGNATFSTFLTSFKTVLNYIGINLDIDALDRFEAFIEFKSSNGYIYSSNIYSALKPYTADFGYLGVILFPFIIGAFYQWLYVRAKRHKYAYPWLLYSMLIYPVLFFPILEQLFGRFTLGFIYELVWLAIIYYFAIGGRKRILVKKIVPNVNGAQNAKQ